MLNYGTSRSKCFKDLNAKTALKYDKLSLKSAHRLNASEICTLGNSFYIRERVKGLGTSVFFNFTNGLQADFMHTNPKSAKRH